MEKRIQGTTPDSHDLAHVLKAQLNYQWIDDGYHEPWELRFLFQPVDIDCDRFKINIAILANRNGTPHDLKHVLYLELIGHNSELFLGWSAGVNPSSGSTVEAFKAIYPLQQIISDIRIALGGYRLEVAMPETNAA